MPAIGNRSKKWATAMAIVFTWPGVPVTACASIRPRTSYTPAERSPASRVIGPKAVLSSTCACSSTSAISRFQITWRCSASRMSFMVAPNNCGPDPELIRGQDRNCLQHQVPIARELHTPAFPHERRRLRLGDHHRAGMPLERHERIARQFRTTSVISGIEIEDLALLARPARGFWNLRLLPCRARRSRDHVPGEELDRHAMHAHVELLLVARLVAFPQVFYVRSRKIPIRERDHDFMSLADVAHLAA